MNHALERTSPKGGPFLGTCINCGKTNLPMRAAHLACENTLGRTQDETLLAAIEGLQGDDADAES